MIFFFLIYNGTYLLLGIKRGRRDWTAKQLRYLYDEFICVENIIYTCVCILLY